MVSFVIRDPLSSRHWLYWLHSTHYAVNIAANIQNRGHKLHKVVSTAYPEFPVTINTYKDYKYLEESVCYGTFEFHISY